MTVLGSTFTFSDVRGLAGHTTAQRVDRLRRFGDPFHVDPDQLRDALNVIDNAIELATEPDRPHKRFEAPRRALMAARTLLAEMFDHERRIDNWRHGGQVGEKPVIVPPDPLTPVAMPPDPLTETIRRNRGWSETAAPIRRRRGLAVVQTG